MSSAGSATRSPCLPTGALTLETETRYPFVAIDATPDRADELAAALFELGALGVEERDEQTLARGARAGCVTLVGAFETRDAAEQAMVDIVEAFPDVSPRLEEVVGDAWRDAWKEHFAPFPLTPHITVVPPWAARPAVPEGVALLELEPGRAFGTGLHASTSLVSEHLDASREALAGCELLDVGTGSGILSLVALVYGAARAVAIDLDADVIEVVRENAARNGLGERVETWAGTVDKVQRLFPWVLANIEARVLRPIAPDLVRVLAPGGTLILSGILESEHDEMVRLYTSLPRGLKHASTRRRAEASVEGWVAIAFTAPQ